MYSVFPGYRKVMLCHYVERKYCFVIVCQGLGKNVFTAECEQFDDVQQAFEQYFEFLAKTGVAYSCMPQMEVICGE